MQARQHLTDGGDGIKTLLDLLTDQMGNDLGIGFAGEDPATADQFVTQRLKFSMMPLCTTAT